MFLPPSLLISRIELTLVNAADNCTPLAGYAVYLWHCDRDVEIYASLAAATTASNAIHTTQLALPQDVCETVYAATGYAASVCNLSQVSLTQD